jgi:hypothetical protein
MDDLFLAFSDAFGEPSIGVSAIPDTTPQFGVELRSRRLGVALDGRLHVVELSPEQLLALGTAATIAARVAGADEAVALSMLSRDVTRTLEALLDRRLVKAAGEMAREHEVAGNA